MRNKKPMSNQPTSFAEVVRHVHHEIVRTCEYCGKPMTRSDVKTMAVYVKPVI